MDITGTIIQRSTVEQKTETFKLQQFYLDASTYNTHTGQQYKNILKFHVLNDKIDLLSKIADNVRVKVYFNPRGRTFEHEGETKHAQDLQAWKFEELHPTGSLTQPHTPAPAPASETKSKESTTDLPF